MRFSGSVGVLGVGALALAVGAACTSEESELLTDEEWELVSQMSPLPEAPVDTTNRLSGDPDGEAFGKALFYDPGISPSGEISCATCHDPEQAFADGLRLSEGESIAARNAPGLLNTAHSEWYFWDGGCDTLWCQAMGPVENAVEMGSSRLYVAHHIFNTPALAEAYEALFGELPPLDDADRFPATARPIPENTDHDEHKAWETMSEEDQEVTNLIFANFAKAVAAFERTIESEESPFDRFVRGLRDDDETLIITYPDDALRGLKLFVGKGGCVECHSGPYLTNGEFYNNGVGGREWLVEPDLGRYEGVTDVLDNIFNAAGPYSDDPEGERASRLDSLEVTNELLGAYRVPTLRNVAGTAPYMHGGQHETLAEAIRYYNVLDETPVEGVIDPLFTPLGLDDGELADLEAFLISLTGQPVTASLP